MSEVARCELCGEPMPPGEEMFKYHGLSGECPKPPLPREKPLASVTVDGEFAHVQFGCGHVVISRCGDRLVLEAGPGVTLRTVLAATDFLHIRAVAKEDG